MAVFCYLIIYLQLLFCINKKSLSTCHFYNNKYCFLCVTVDVP